MPPPKQPLDPKVVLTVQIQMLQMALDEHEQSWDAIGFSTIPNPIAERLRGDIAEKKSLLALNQQPSGHPTEADLATGSVTGQA
jgi:hypothetical protein